MKTFWVTYATVAPPLRMGPYDARTALSVVEQAIVPEGMIQIEDENSATIDIATLRHFADLVSRMNSP